MIESCNKRRMIISIIVLGILTVVILILEEKLTSDWNQTPAPTPAPQGSDLNVDRSELEQSAPVISAPNNQKQIKSSNDECWVTEEFKIVADCAPCTHFETNSGSNPACKPTGLKETVNCNISGAVFRSCSEVPSVAKTRFWIFESLMLLIAVVSYGYCRYRTSQIERSTIKQIERRLASGM